MLTPEYLMRVSEGSEEIAEYLHEDIINRIVERIVIRANRGNEYMLTSLDKWQIDVLQEAGYLFEEIEKEISRRTQQQAKEIKDAFEDAGVTALNYDDKIYKASGISTLPLWESPVLLRIMQRNYEATMGEWKNFTRTTAEKAQYLFISELDKAYNLVSSGTVSYTQAYLEAINNIINDGVMVLYPSGHRDTVETATLRSIRTGISQMASQITTERMKEVGWDIVVVSSHMGARYTGTGDYKDHQWWQGKFYSLSGKNPKFQPFSVCGMGNVQGICGANCRHSFGPGDGENNPYEKYDTEENRKAYELEQKQRNYERRIRDTKRKAINLKTALENAKDEKMKLEIEMEYWRKSALLRRQQKIYKDYCKDNNLKQRQERIAIAKWTRKQAAEAREAAKIYNDAKGQK